MELRRIVINKEIIIQKLSSNKYVTKEIPKNDKMDCSTNKDEEYCKPVTECSNPPNENVIHHKKDSNQYLITTLEIAYFVALTKSKLCVVVQKPLPTLAQKSDDK